MKSQRATHQVTKTSALQMVYQYTKNENGQFICQHCKFTAEKQNTMHYHLAKHEGSLPHGCKHCNQRFPQKGVLDLHIKLKHADKLVKKDTFKCPCEGCEYEDIRKGNRLIHFLRVHLKDLTEKLKVKSEQGLSCDNCKKEFKSNTMFYYHAHTCVSPQDNHACYNAWQTIKTA